MNFDALGPEHDSIIRDDIAQTITVGMHFALLGIFTIATAQPFLFPSLGPSVYLLARSQGEQDAASDPYHVIGGHLVATVAGFIGYHLLASDFAITSALQQPPFTGGIFWLVVSSILAMMLTTLGMLVTGSNHPAACATTLIVSLGLLSTLSDVAYIMLAVVVLVVAHKLVIYPAAIKFGFEPKDPRED